MDTSLFTPIMVIGTILALIFAAGALWNSLVRKRHLAKSETEPEEERIVFQPLSSSESEENEESASDPEKGSVPSSHTPLFRQIRPSGILETPGSGQGEEDLYVWE